MERFHNNKMDTRLRNLSPWRKQGWEGGKTKTTWDGWTNTIEKAEIGSCGCWNVRIHLKRNTPVKRIDMTILIIMKDWYSHRSMRTPFGEGMESTLDIEATRIPQLKTKQRIGLQNKPEQTYDRDFVRSFRGGAYTGSIVQHHHVQGSAHDIRSVPESA